MQINYIKHIIDMISDSNLKYFECSTEKTYIKIMKEENLLDNKINEEIACTKMEKSELKKKEYIVESKYVASVKLINETTGKSFVSIKESVKKGDKLCALEYLNISIDILAPIDGILTQIYVTDNSMIEYGKKMFLIYSL